MKAHDASVPGRRQEVRSILINFVLDKSGSMDAIRAATISGFNEFLGDQQREGGDARLTLTLFDTHLTPLASAVPIREIAPLDLATFEPGGMTALYDAIGHTMTMTDDFYAEHKPDQVLFVIMTDGAENASREFDRARIFTMIEDRQKLAGYEFLYLGANQDSCTIGHELGLREGRTLDYAHTAGGARETMQRVSHNVSAYRRQGAAQVEDGAFFSEAFEASGAREYEEHKRAFGEEAGPAAGE